MVPRSPPVAVEVEQEVRPAEPAGSAGAAGGVGGAPTGSSVGTSSPGSFGGGASTPSTVPGGAGIPGGGIGPGAGINGSPAVTGPTTPNVGVQTNPAPASKYADDDRADNDHAEYRNRAACPPGTGSCPTVPGGTAITIESS